MPSVRNSSAATEFLTRAAEIEQSVSFDVGTVAAGDAVRPFANIEFGKPLNILIRRVYTGRFPEKKIFGSRKPMLITSAIKDISTTSAAAQAINVLKQSVTPRSVFSGPSAREEGTSLLYYSPAVASSLITVSIQMMFDDFDDELFTRAGQLFELVRSAYLCSGSRLSARRRVDPEDRVRCRKRHSSRAMRRSMKASNSTSASAEGHTATGILGPVSPALLDLKNFSSIPTIGLVDKVPAAPMTGMILLSC